ncbi:zinc finger protein 676-like isoform X2 [Artemia franciscana]|uniref:C2H2-type domain-containing protein n=2 Tax=Artemia franciscana TaxID=6661 RepID=A0AA88HWZ9_ARTSF|nr:hypothetical protein QYM36_010331 [Artemia franciscana]KAK2715717.1 hypothetical protein QYM36_010331 [Artemia franciscana]KAK2715718.1 hypothetical protein QYM36_010331 [Artemia franciscana]
MATPPDFMAIVVKKEVEDTLPSGSNLVFGASSPEFDANLVRCDLSACNEGLSNLNKEVETTVSQLGKNLSSEQEETSSTADFASVYIKQEIDSDCLSVWPRNSYSSVENQQENCLDEKPFIPQEEENFPLLDHLLPNASVDGNLLFNVEPSFSEQNHGFISWSDDGGACTPDQTQNKSPGTGEKPYKCEVCKREFTYQSIYKNHMKIHSGERPYSCKVCQKAFSNLYNLGQHTRIHIGEKEYHCKICNRGFNVKCNLSYHMRIHSGEKPYQCEICKKSFPVSSGLSRHKVVHTGEKPFKCTICNMAFSQKYVLSNHMKKHDGEKLLECDICLKKLRTSLSEHKKIHTGEKPYKCTICNKVFCQKGSLYKHMVAHKQETASVASPKQEETDKLPRPSSM